jgi:dTDP-4-amino-4,6-dideoxygalactose transaminase
MTPPHIPLLDVDRMNGEAQPALSEAWARVLDRSEFVGGELVERFEEEWARYCGVPFAVGVGNGTDALELSLRALGIGTADEVIVPANTFVATAEAVVSVGAEPYFVDVELGSLLIDPAAAAAAIGPRTAAIIPVHLFGQMADMRAILRLAGSAGIEVVEDAAQGHGATQDGRRSGSMATAGCFSFYPGKNLGALGDAGAVVTAHRDLAERIRSLANHGRAGPGKHHHSVVGRNSRLDSLQAAALSAKLPYLDRWNSMRRSHHARYVDRLAASRIELVEQMEGNESVFHLEVSRLPERDMVAQLLAGSGISTGIHYPIPCHRQPAFESFPRGDVRVAEKAATEILSLPMFPHMADTSIDLICEVLRRSVAP